jgi:phosphohistidine phosphatase
VKVVLIRHATAVPRGTPGIPDDDRPLTPRGRRRFRKAARGLARVIERPDLLLTSPLPRAFATAEIAAQAWGRVRPTPEPAFARGSVKAMLAALARQPAGATVAVVGHEPGLSELLAHLLGRGAAQALVFRKGGAALVEVPGFPPEGGRLVWFLPPKVLRSLRRL